MRSCTSVRFSIAAGFVLALFAGVTIVSAQDATAEPTEDAMMSQMMMMHGACPEGVAAKLFERMAPDMGMMTEEPMMGATEDMGMTGTEEPMMSATEDMGMTGTEEAIGAKCLVAEVQGANEVPGPGDDDGWGVALISLDASSGTVCYDIAVGNLTLPAAANHIHEGDATVKGGVVVPFPTAPDADGKTSGCTTADAALVQQIVDNPSGYYYNVHTSDFPDGAARGQLMSWDDMVTHLTDTGMDMSDLNMDGMTSTGGIGAAEMTPEATQGS